jgi:small conductance mechanosensitive channel
MYLARRTIATLTAVICFILIVILSLTVTLTNEEEEKLYEAVSSDQAAKSLNSAIFSIVLPSGRRSSTTQAAARWDNRRITWSEKSPEQKLVYMIGMIMLALMIYILFSASRTNNLSQEDTIIRYIVSGNWDKTWNVFALSSCALVLMVTIISIALFRIPVRIITSLLGARGETLGHLLLSVMKYGGTIGAMFYCLYLLGMDATNLLAGVGVLSLVVGLGAQSLIKDILAGIFIVFEGEFRVGDIVTISDFRGTVLDIGLRTTKILGGNGNIKIFNNSEITGVLNMTKEISVASATIDIEYGQDLDYVDAVLARELPLLKEKNPKIVDGPTSLGVSALGASGVSITVIARCTEQNVRAMNRFLNRELLQIFYRNDINVPFPNVTVSQLDPKPRKTLKDLPEDSEEKEEDKK